ncbi:hypothetical protein AYO44_18430 [Planctomycetaceae bacterium SCGC AG-212-F19]|nr:hypothetical protein AYO44_18430 [Planctomycetaceae bacterium SCGC AG-212-F19]
MRAILEDPFGDDLALEKAITLARELYRLHERGADYAVPLDTLSCLVGKLIHPRDITAAFVAVDPEAFARDLLLNRVPVPRDLSYEEMLELVRRICSVEGSEFQIGYWLTCLKANTGHDNISDLIYWPAEYFGDGDRSREMSPKEILDAALAAGRK